MRIIVCIDKKNGMMFNHRRQSRDKAQIADMARLLGGAPLRIAPYSEKLLSDSGIVLAVSEDPLADAGSDDWCFIEDRSVASCADRVTEATGTGITPAICFLTWIFPDSKRSRP